MWISTIVSGLRPPVTPHAVGAAVVGELGVEPFEVR
jgi:hypothetical protein